MKKRKRKIRNLNEKWARQQNARDKKYIRKVKQSAFYKRILELQKENKHLHSQLARQIKLRQESLVALDSIRRTIQDHYQL